MQELLLRSFHKTFFFFNVANLFFSLCFGYSSTGIKSTVFGLLMMNKASRPNNRNTTPMIAIIMKFSQKGSYIIRGVLRTGTFGCTVRR